MGDTLGQIETKSETEPMQIFATDPNKPYKRVLLLGVALYVVVVAIALILNVAANSPDVAPGMFVGTILLPIFSLLLIPFGIWTLYCYSILAGAPGVSIGYAWTMFKRNWRGFVGGLLIAVELLMAVFELRAFA